MLSQILSLYLNPSISHFEVLKPTIGMQPIFFSAPFDLPDRYSKYISPMSFIFYKGISLELSVDYKHSEENSLEDISKNFIFSETEITLTKYIKITNSLEIYTEEIHKPQRINLPSTDQQVAGFSLYISRVPTEYDIGVLKKGSQLISFYINYETALEAKDSSKQIEKLRELLKIGKTENLFNCGFQFTIILKQRNRKVQTLQTNMFQIVFSNKKNHDGVLIYEVRSLDYYIEKHIEKMKKGCVIS